MTSQNKIIKKYSHLSFWERFHILSRLKLCPWERIIDNVPKGRILIDIGCGHGLFANLLDLRGNFEQIIGVDPATAKIAVAQRSQNNKVQFFSEKYEDIHYAADIVTIMDVLYLVPHNIQEELLKSIYARLPSGGYLIIKDNVTTPRWKFLIGYLEELIMVRLLGATFGSNFYFRSVIAWKKLLSSMGFKVKSIDLQKGYPYPHMMFICQK